MRRFKTVLLLFAMVLIAGKTSAEEKELYIDGNIQTIFTSEDGLLSTSTQAIAQTSEGFIWIGGYGGLVRYDGKKFEPFAYKKITRVTDLAAGSDGVLWAATSDKGLFRCEDNEFDTVSGTESLDIESLVYAPDDHLYLGTDEGLYILEEDEVQRVEIPQMEGETIERLTAVDENRFLFVTGDGRLLLWDGRMLISDSCGGDVQLRSACVNPEGGYLAGTRSDEVLVLGEDLTVLDRVTMKGLNCINDVRCDESGAWWLCADNGIAVYVNGSIRMQNMLMDNSVDRMLVDQEGNDWFISSRQGVLEVSRSKFGDVSQCAGLSPMVVNAIQRIGDTLYIGHDAGMVTIDAGDFKKIRTSPLDILENTRVRALLADSRGDLWIGTMKKGLFRYTPGGETVCFDTKNSPALFSDNVRTIRETDEGILIGTDQGAYLIRDDEVINVAEDPEELNFRILCAAKFGDTIWLGSDGTGMYLLRDGKIVTRYTEEDGLSSDVIMKEYRSDAFGGVWLVTGNNIDFVSDDGTITSIDNFPSTNNLDLLIMENGDAWVFTGSGIYLTTEESLLKDENPQALQFRRADGLPYEITPNAYQCMTDDVLYVCGTGGVFTLQTDFSSEKSGDVQMVIDSVSMDGRQVYMHPDETCRVEAGIRRLGINAYVLTYQTGNPQVFYYLEGFDEKETTSRLSDLGNISYTNLNGGTYTFHFGIRDYRTGDVLQEITLPIVKAYPWYRLPLVQLLAATLALLLIVAAMIAAIRIRAGRIRRMLQKEYEQKERSQLKTMAYKDYLTGLYNRNYLDVWNSVTPEESAYPVCYVSIDMNDLKKINDRYGHKSGDQLLCNMSDMLKKHFPDGRFTLLRIGGDEFLILARGVSQEDMHVLMEQMAQDGSKYAVDGIPVTFAYGVCEQQQDSFDFEEGLRKSDMTMLEAKDIYHGRGRE